MEAYFDFIIACLRACTSSLFIPALGLIVCSLLLGLFRRLGG